MSRYNLHLTILLIFCLLLTFRMAASGQENLAATYSPSVLQQVLPEPLRFGALPQAKDKFWTSTIPMSMRNSYIQYGRTFKGKAWVGIPDSLFADYQKTGNRTGYEREYFARRKQISNLVMAEIMEHKGVFMNDIINGIHYFFHETWWGLPAHYPTDHPVTDNQVVDLFNGETANLLAWTIYMLHDELEEREVGICKKTRNEIARRFLNPARTKQYAWKNGLNNWNTWICSNWLSCVLLCEEHRDWQMEAIRQIVTSLDKFYEHYPDDGGCEEGINYWERAGASFIECMNLLELATNQHPDIKNGRKIHAIASYPYNMYIGNGKYTNWADASQTVGILPNISFCVGHYLSDHQLMNYARYVGDQYKYIDNAGKVYNASGNYPFLSRELLFLTQYNVYRQTTPVEPLLQYTCLPDLQISTARSTENSTDGLFLAAKGGHNGESHNHNDVGNFIIYKNAEPLIIDIGVGTYTAQTFSAKRYELFNCRSAYHNVPLINGMEQHEGKQYRAQKVKFSNKKKRATMSLDIAEAYPKEACVDKWQRTIRLNRGKDVVITEKYKLSEYKQPTELILICCGKALFDGDNKIVIDNGKTQGTLLFDHHELTARIEKIDHQDAVIQNSWQQRELYRIRLILREPSLKGKTSYSVK